MQKTNSMKKFLLTLSVVLISSVTLANNALNAIGDAIAMMVLMAIGACLFIGLIATLASKKHKLRNFFLGFAITALLMLLVILSL